MPYFKDTTNKVYFFDDVGEADKYLPVGSVRITDAELSVLLPPVEQEIKPDEEIARLSLDAVPDIIDWLARNAVGADKTAMQAKLAEINVQRAKKTP